MIFPQFLSDKDIKKLQEKEAESNKAQKRTPEQIEAIYCNGQNILVSASAGSGKTFVMVERIIDKVMRGIAIDEMFISTFTVKAATELKERLEKRLLALIKESSDAEWKAYLNQQLQGISQADIGTMDAFTQKLLSQYSYTLGISPKFRIMQDKSEQDILKNRIYESIFANYMDSKESLTFMKTVKNFSGHRKDSKGFRAIVYKIYEFSQSTEDPLEWLEKTFLKASNSYTDFGSLPDTDIEALLQSMQRTATSLRDLTELEDYGQLTKAGKPSAKYQKHLQMIQLLQEWSLHFDTYYGKEQISQLARDVLALLPTGDAVTINKRKYSVFKDLQARLKDVQHLETIFTFQAETLPLLKLLQAFVLDFSKAYLKAKIEENAFEFSDVAHFAIAILENNPEIQVSYQNKYHEVMVDEYQDNNHIQEKLLELLSNGHNRFMVGDIKQSIYRFRQADPLIFNQKFKDYQENPENGRLILLKENFRSQSEVLAVTNAVFSRLMDEAVGDILYDTSHRLLPGSSRQEESFPENRCQLLLYNTDSQDQSQQPDSSEMLSDNQVSPGEVKIVAKEIIRLHNDEQVAFSDITLLVSSRTRNDNILRTFNRLGIPLVSDGGLDHYLQSVEIMVMLDTLRTINNPLNDYALVALLKSPMFAFDEDQLARIALQESRQDKVESFYEKIQNALSKKGLYPDLVTNDLQESLIRFDKILKQWRLFAKKNSLYDLIWKIYNDRFYFDYVATSPKAEQAQANLYALALRASQFEKTGYRGLSRFISMIDRILETENDLADVDIVQAKDAVNLMTIHKSKGLEFKYVFILNCDKKFSFKDLYAPAILDRQQGIGIKYLADFKTLLDAEQLSSLKVTLETLPYQMNRKALKRATLSEQMRLLYVAMTRAEKKLYLIGKGSQEKLADKYDGQREGNHLPRTVRENLQSFQDWFLAIRESFAQEELYFDLRFESDSDLGDNAIGQLVVKEVLDPDNLAHNRQSDHIARALDMLEKVNQLNQSYHAAIHLPTVQTPSQLKDFYQPIMDSEGVAVIEKSRPLSQASFVLPNFSENPTIDASQIGSSLHELMQKITISERVTQESVRKALTLVNASESLKAKLDLDKIIQFFNQTALGQLICNHHQKLHREAPFAMLKKDMLSQEKFVVRGIIDGYLLFKDKIILFDYKTDKYHQASELKRRYAGQLALYAEALSQAYNIDTVEKYLVLLGGEGLEVVSVL